MSETDQTSTSDPAGQLDARRRRDADLPEKPEDDNGVESAIRARRERRNG